MLIGLLSFWICVLCVSLTLENSVTIPLNISYFSFFSLLVLQLYLYLLICNIVFVYSVPLNFILCDPAFSPTCGSFYWPQAHWIFPWPYRVHPWAHWRHSSFVAVFLTFSISFLRIFWKHFYLSAFIIIYFSVRTFSIFDHSDFKFLVW